jgi:tetratricopeptide (TPR) repeat protein
MNVDDLEEKDILNAAKIAEAAERYKDMCGFLHKLVETKCSSKETLTVEERNLLSVAYKNVVGTKRQSWRMLTQANFDNLDETTLGDYKKTIEKELEEVCTEVLALLVETTKVAEDANADESKEDLVFYLKMSGDYYRYLSEFITTSDNKEKAEKFYEEATKVAEDSLPETHPTRLGLALNYSVCCYEITDKKELACDIAKKAFDSAIEKLDTLNDSSYKDSTLIMQLLRDNLTLWTSEKDEPDKEAMQG